MLGTVYINSSTSSMDSPEKLRRNLTFLSLMDATKKGDLNKITELIAGKSLAERKSLLSQCNKKGSSPIIKAIRLDTRCKDRNKIISFLFSKGAPIDLSEPNNAIQPLIQAINSTDKETVSYLLQEKARMTYVNDSGKIRTYTGKDGMTPLQSAIKVKNVPIVDLLIKHGVKIDKLDLNYAWALLHENKEGEEPKLKWWDKNAILVHNYLLLTFDELAENRVIV